MNLTPERTAAFWDLVRKDPDGCWIWTGASSAPPHHEARYGTFRVGGRMRKAHRIAYLITREDPGPAEVLHSCDNTLCVRPDHLSLGTHADNMRDMIAKGRDRGRAAKNRAKTHCDKKHPLSGLNLYVKPRPGGCMSALEASRLVVLLAADPPRRGDSAEVAEAKALAAARAWCESLRARGERVTFGGLLLAGGAAAEDGAA